MRFRRILAGLLVLMWVATPARAELRLGFGDGRVTLVARDVSVQQILAEWAKIGGTQIVNLDRISAAPVTLQLDGIPERQALEVILRSVAGYVAAPRRPENPGVSQYDRILVMAVSNPPAAPAAVGRPVGSPPAGSPPAFPPAPRDFVTPTPGPGPVFPTPTESDPEDDDAANPVPPRPGVQFPGMPVVPPPAAMPGAAQPNARPPSGLPTGASVPGVVVPAPQPPNPPGAQPPKPDR
jgi:hypothetical protein